MENSSSNSAPTLTPEEKAKRYEEWRAKRLADLKAECVRALMGQTTWTEEEAVKHLEEHKYNVLACVRVFMGMPPIKEKPSSNNTYSSVNQGIYSEIRSLMDEASRNYEMKKKREERLQELQMQRQAILEARQEQLKQKQNEETKEE